MCFGSGAMTNTMEDSTSNSQAMFIIGSNTTEQHPVLGSKIRQAVAQRNVPLVVADPRKIDIVDFAVLHLQHRPGTDVALINGIMNVILSNGWQDKDFSDIVVGAEKNISWNREHRREILAWFKTPVS